MFFLIESIRKCSILKLIASELHLVNFSIEYNKKVKHYARGSSIAPPGQFLHKNRIRKYTILKLTASQLQLVNFLIESNKKVYHSEAHSFAALTSQFLNRIQYESIAF